MNILGNGVALDCENLCGGDGVASARRASASRRKTCWSATARRCCCPWHRELDALEEARLKDKQYGSTKQRHRAVLL